LSHPLKVMLFEFFKLLEIYPTHKPRITPWAEKKSKNGHFRLLPHG
jgi:hypothetical protein